jgi:flagellar assembly factor FliW
VADEQKFKIFKEQTHELFGKLEEEQNFREEQDENLIKDIKGFENEVKFKITKCKNVSYHTYLLTTS